MNETIKTKFKAGKYLMPVTMTRKDGRIYMQFQYNKILIEEMKCFDGSKWDPELKCWHIPDSQRNRFQLEVLQGKNPYARYDLPLVTPQPKRKLYSHQVEMVAHGLTRHYCVFACEMGCLRGDTLINGITISTWFYRNKLPIVKAYDSNGDIIETQTSRITRKKQKIVRIKTGNVDLRVGSQHLFLAIKDGKPCHTRAINLTPAHSLVTDKSLGTMITSIQLTQNKKHTGMVSGMEMVQSTNRMVLTKVNCLLKKLKQLNNLPLTLNVVKSQIMANLCYLEYRGWICLKNQKEGIHSLQRISGDTSLEACLMLTDPFQSTVVDELETFMQLYVMLQEVCLELFQTTSRLGLFQGTLQTKSQSMVVTEYKNWLTIFTKVQQDILNTKQLDLEKPTKFLVAKESDHLIPFSFQQLGELSLKNASITMEPATWVYDLTIPKYGNYFDDDGINHQNTGKTLAAIEIMESLVDIGREQAWYVGPKSGVRAVELELIKWNSAVFPRMFTYEQLTKEMKNWVSGTKAPRIVIFDESSKIKTPTAQRSQAAMALADGVRSDWGDEGFVILMSGTPAPKSPVDWFHQVEVAQPGFFKEGNIHKFRNRLAIIEERENVLTGGKYPHLMGWRDNEKRCNACGKMKEDIEHDLMGGDPKCHPFVPCKNEVAYLYERMNGLVLVRFKKDCLDLPEKQYKIITIKPAADLLMVARSIKKTGSRAIEVLTLLRELSDGFQYKEVETGEYQTCHRCNGTGKVMIPVPKEEVDFTQVTREINESMFENKEMVCDHCGGDGKAMTYTRGMDEVPCPKDDQLKLDLEDHEEYGRLIVWGGFTGTIDRIVKVCQTEGWSVLRVDGRGYCAMDEKGQPLDDRECLMAMDASHPRKQEFLEKYPKICFVGHPKAGGMALTLTASPTEIFFSNDFSGEGRMQAEDRFHRAGMDKNRGATIVDYIHLPSDLYVLENLKKKRDLQKLSMGELDDLLKSIEQEKKD